MSSRFLSALLAAAAVAAWSGAAAAQETDYAPTGTPPPPGAHVEPAEQPVGDATAPTAPGTALPAAPADALSPPPPAGSTGSSITVMPGGVAAIDAYDGALHLPAQLSTRMRALDRDFAALAARGSSNIVDGILSLVSGAALIGLGVAFQGTEPNLSIYLYVSGGAILLRAAVEFLVEPTPLDPAVAYAHMPTRDRSEVDARLRYGEQALEGLAQRSQLARILESTISIASAPALCFAYYLPRGGFNEREAVDWLVLVSAGLSAVTGFATLLSRRDAERRWDAYKEMRDALSPSEAAVQLGIAPLPGGAAITAFGRL